MEKKHRSELPRPFRLRFYALGTITLWTLIITLSLIWNLKILSIGTLEAARVESRTVIETDILYRRWNAMHGGLYAPVTDVTRPNPYLNVTERDITTPSGLKLTKINPAFMTRQVHELAQKSGGVQGHITSLKPIQPANAPDPWETRALKAFQNGAKEIRSVENISSQSYMRLMHPLRTEKGCLKCHALQGYQPGDIRGGISVSVPLIPFLAIEKSNIFTLAMGHGMLWVAGLIGIGLGLNRLNIQVNERRQTEEELYKLNLQLEQRVKQRTAALVKTNEKLQREIEERRHAESALRESEMQLKAAQAIAHVGSYVIDVGEERLHWSEEQFRIFGYEPGEVTPDFELVKHHLHPDDLQRFEKAHKMAFSHDKAYNYEYRIRRKDGAVRHVHSIAKIEHDEEGKPRRIFGTLQDITETKLLERHLLQSEKLASMGLLVSGIAHEINNPNNFITFNIPILRDYLKELIPIVDAYDQNHQDMEWCGMSYPELRKDIFNLLDNVEHGANRITAIVSGLREFGRKKDHITLRRIDLKKVIERVVTICQGEINKRVKSFEVNVSERLPLIKTDPEIMEQILINLLINAAQAADKENSWVKLDVGSKNPGEGYLALEVSDNGCGIDDEDRKRIFDPFFTTKAPQEGTGLGLSITYSLIEGLGGRIEVESEIEKGTTFTVMFPTTKAEDPLKILVVDDDRVIRSVVSMALARVGRYQVTEASSGTEACIQIGNDRPDLLILDIQMPDMDGVEVCRLIKKKPELASIKVIIITGFPDSPKVTEIKRMGFNSIISKPLQAQKFIKTVDAVLTKGP